MWEFEQFDRKTYNKFLIPEISSKTSRGYKIKEVKTGSLSLWTEHCSECGYPSCYKTCDLYEPRFDLHCRTLRFGMKKASAFSGIRRYSAMVVPKEWATLDAVISLFQIPFSLLRILEETNYIFAHLVKTSSQFLLRFSPKKVPLRAFGILRGILIDSISALGRKRPEAFLLQVYNGCNTTCKISVKFTNVPPTKDTLFFQKQFLLYPGENEFVVPFSEISRYLNLNERIRAYLSSHGNRYPLLYFAAADLVIFKKPYFGESALHRNKLEQQKIKCLVWDLDNTIWKGVLSESPETIEINPDAVRLIKTLDKRGIIHSLASKNNPEDAMSMLKQHGLDEYFVYPQINWQPKSASIEQIVKDLNIGMNTVAFVDDSQFELSEVSSRFPDILTVNASVLTSVANHPRFSGSTSADSSNRRFFYKAEERRKDVQIAFSGSYEDFLLRCNMKILLTFPNDSDLDRLYELVQRTNQLNFTGNRYSKEDLAELIHSKHCDCFVIACKDDFGDYGTVGFSIIRPGKSDVTVEELAISCRVQSKRVEQMFFKTLMKHYDEQGKTLLKLIFKNSGKNVPAQMVIQSIGFTILSENNGQSLYQIEAASHIAITETAVVDFIV